MYGSVNERGFRFALQVIYISFLAFDSDLSRRGASLRQGGLFSIITDTTGMVGIFLVRFLEEGSTTSL